ncbi:hypothetical protein YC2023_026762 [Brassica napus]
MYENKGNNHPPTNSSSSSFTLDLTGASSSSGKGLTAVSTATWVRIPATGELTFRHRQGQRTDTWQHVTSLDHLCGARIPLYNSKKKRIPRIKVFLIR